jgi:hypothetical protein
VEKNIKTDLQSLYDYNFIEEAKNLNSALSKEKKYFHDNMQPMYFNGKMDAKTVMIMLNPGV